MMAKVAALDTFNMTSMLDLSVLGEIAEDFEFLDNVNFALLGNVFQDVAAYQFTTDTTQLVAFGGKNFSFINGIPVSGRVTGIALTDGALSDGLEGQSLNVLITGISVGTVDIAKAVASASKADDLALIADMFKGNDRFDLSEGNDIAFGLAGADKMFGNGGNDLLAGGDGIDTLAGGAGNDVLEGGNGADIINGGVGSDTASYATASTGQTINLGVALQANGDRLISIENVQGSALADQLTAGRVGAVLDGGGGGDTLVGGLRADTLSGGTGNDVLTGGGGNDLFLFDAKPVSSNADVITDFARGRDKIVLSSEVFTGLDRLGTNGLDPSNFIRSASATATSARDGNDHLIYNSTTGILFFDADGVGGKAGVAIAQIGTDLHPNLAASDILIL